MKTKEILSLKVVIFALLLGILPLCIINAQSIASLEALEALEATVDRGEAAIKAGDYDRAIREFTEVIRLINGMKLNGNSQQIAFLNESLAIAYRQRALTYELKNDYDRAIADYTETINIDKTDDGTFSKRGLMYMKKNDWDRAIADFTQALRLNSQNTDAYFDRGNAYFFKNDYNRAIADWEALLKIDPNNANVKRYIEIVRNQLRQ